MPDVQPKKCFIAMPVSTSPEHSAKYGDDDHWKHVLEEVLVPAVEKAGFEAVRPTAQGTSVIHARIISELSECAMVVCDLSALNPNVLFELGVRTSLNLPIALVAETDTRLPFDVGSLNTHFYDPSLAAWRIRDEVSRLAAHITESEAACDGVNPLWRHFGYTRTAQEPSTEGVSRTDARVELLSEDVTQLRRLIEHQMIVDDRLSFDHTLAARHLAGGPAPVSLFMDALKRFDAKQGKQLGIGYIAASPSEVLVYVSADMPEDTRARLFELAHRYEVRLDLRFVDPAFPLPPDAEKMLTPLRWPLG